MRLQRRQLRDDGPQLEPTCFWHVQLEVVTVARTEDEARQRVAEWLTEHHAGVDGWVNVRKQEER